MLAFRYKEMKIGWHDASHMTKMGERGGLMVSASDSGARGWGFDTYLRRVVSFEQDTFTPQKY